MKKSFLLLLLPLIFFSGCASVNKNENNTASQIDSRYTSATEGIGLQLQQENFTAAYMRMSESYKNIYSESEFAQNCQKFLNGKTIVSYNSQPNQIQGNYYIYTKLICKMSDESLQYLTLAFNKNANFPVDLLFKELTQESSLPLRQLCQNDFKIGTGMTGYTPSNSAMRYGPYKEIAAEHFSSATSTNLMKPSSIMNQQKSQQNLKDGLNQAYLDFSNVDPILTWAQDNNVKVRGHTLVWHTQAPKWFFTEDFTDNGNLVDRETMIQRTDSYIKEYLTYCQEKYPDVVYCWDVVNEAVDPSAGDKESFFHCRMTNGGEKNYWYYTIGADYPEIAFRIARKYAAENVKLFYNDYGTTDTTKRSYIYKLCKDLADKGLIDGIGMQSYWDLQNPPLRTISNTIENYAELGLEIQLTEWSMSVKDETEANFDAQAERYASIFRLLKKLDENNQANITCVSFFGLMDHYPYYNNDETTSRLWDKNLEPKPVFYAVQDTLAFN